MIPSGTTVNIVIAYFGKHHRKFFGNVSIRYSSGKAIENHMVMLNGVGLVMDKQSTIEVKEGDRIIIFFPLAADNLTGCAVVKRSPAASNSLLQR